MTTIGEKIIAAILEGGLVRDDLGNTYCLQWHPNAAAHLTALVQQHIDEQVRLLTSQNWSGGAVPLIDPPSNLPTD